MRDAEAHGATAARRALAASLCVAVVAAATLAGAANDGDHPLVARYPGSEIANREGKDFGRYRLVVGLDTKSMTFEGKDLEGKLTRIVYRNPAERSTLEIFRNYREALEHAGAEVLYACEQNACGPAYGRSAWNRFNGLFAAADGDPRYLAARVAAGDAQAYVAVMVGKQRTQLDVVEIHEMERGLVAVDPSALAKAIERDGAARVYGIHFDVDEAEILPASKPALDAIAELLRRQPKLAIFVVGHTDATGALDHNLELSRDRARSVVAALTADYGIASDRLAAHGVGPLAPVATNATDDGRRLNRRVELIAR